MFTFIRWIRTLREKGILGINQRNADYILRYNRRALYPLVDDKIQTKKLAMKAGIAVPALYGVIQMEHQIKSLGELLKKHEDFVIKPAHGAGGDGILVIPNRIQGRFRTAGQSLLTLDDICFHVSNILSGMFSLGGHRDQAMIEYRVKFAPLFAKITYRGVPDIRIIVLKGYPVLAMVRLPTQQSAGKANLHQGAVGVGVDIATGQTVGGVWLNERIDIHPDTANSVIGVTIPQWDTFLKIAAGCYELTGLGYLGIDLVLDETLGPMMLEMNARPGLNIQIANNVGLLTRLKVIENEQQERNILERVAFSRDMFRSEP